MTWRMDEPKPGDTSFAIHGPGDDYWSAIRLDVDYDDVDTVAVLKQARALVAKLNCTKIKVISGDLALLFAPLQGEMKPEAAASIFDAVSDAIDVPCLPITLVEPEPLRDLLVLALAYAMRPAPAPFGSGDGAYKKAQAWEVARRRLKAALEIHDAEMGVLP